MGSFFTELKRRNVFKVGVAYAITAWVIVQVIDVIKEPLHLPDWFGTVVIVLLGIGFLLAMFLAWVYELTPEGIKVTTTAGPAQYHTQATGQRLNYFIIGVLAFAVVFLVIDDYVLQGDKVETVAEEQSSTEPVGQPVPSEPESPYPPNSIAVIPFINISSDPEQEYFADGLSEELMNQLAKINDLLVTARTSSFVFKGRSENVQSIGQQLGVAHVLEGSVRKADNRVLITAQLIDTGNGFHLWSESYNRELQDIFAIQEEISRKVAAALKVTLGIEEELVIGGTDNVAAYDHYLLAQSLARQAGPDSWSKINEAIQMALELDPDFGLAWLFVAQRLTTTLSQVGGFADSFDVDMEKRRDGAIARVMELAPDHPGIYQILATQHVDQKQWLDAELSYREMMARTSENDSDANLSYGTFLTQTGRAREALPYLEKARRLDPVFIQPATNLAVAHDILGNHGRAVELFDSVIHLSSSTAGAMNHFWRLLGHGDVAAAKQLIFELYPGMPDYDPANPDDSISNPDATPIARAFQTMFRTSFYYLDDPEQALPLLQESYADPLLDNGGAMANIAFLAAHFGDADLSFNALRKSLQDSTLALQFIWTPILKRVRSHPGFETLMEEIKLADYWRQAGWPEHCRPLDDEDFECN